MRRYILPALICLCVGAGLAWSQSVNLLTVGTLIAGSGIAVSWAGPGFPTVLSVNGSAITSSLTSTFLTGVTAGTGLTSSGGQTPTLSVSSSEAFLIAAASTQAISSSVSTKVTMLNVMFDSLGNISSSRFTPTVAGYYQLNATLLMSDSVAITAYSLNFVKNGAEYLRGAADVSNVGAAEGVSASVIVYMNGTTDYVELWGKISGTAPSFLYVSSSETSFFGGSFLHG